MKPLLCCGCGAVGRVVASDTRDPQFESSHRQWNIWNVFICQLLSRKDENKEKEAGNGPFKKMNPLLLNLDYFCCGLIKKNYTLSLKNVFAFMRIDLSVIHH